MKLSLDEVRRIAAQHAQAGCESCSGLADPGWQSFPSTMSESQLRKLGTLWMPGEDEPTLAEHHPGGTDYWSPQAPIALDCFPYNRCEIWQCAQCGRPFLRYTEYGGYYEDRRIRPLAHALIVERALPR